MKKSTCIFVFGIESSGTSCVAGVLHTMGVHMGNQFPGPNAANPKGHFEDISFVRLLQDMCSRNFEPAMRKWVQGRLADEKPLWGIKCPSLTEIGGNLFSFMDEHFPRVEKKVIYVQRKLKYIISSSQAKRPKSDADMVAKNVHSSYERLKKLIYTLCHNCPFLAIQYNDMIDRPFDSMARLIDFCYPDGGYDMVRCCEAMQFVDKNLRHWK